MNLVYTVCLEITILVLQLSVAFSLQGDLNSICFNSVREIETVHTSSDQTVEITRWVPKAECCDGYLETNGSCEPQCDPPCEFGDCVAPNQCHCNENYIGQCCEIPLCPNGYTGENCDTKCPQGSYGYCCEGKCTCENGDCDHVTGNCRCSSGWSGPRCTVPCPEGTLCLNGGICNASNTSCDCSSGYFGQQCEQRCGEGYWGKNCVEKCECENVDYFTCDPFTGECHEKCIHGEYFGGTCWCMDGWDGEFCTEIVCPDGFYGEDCSKPCPCDLDNTMHCDRFTGKCSCYPGWIGDQCQESCPYMTFGEGCNGNCSCETDHHQGCDCASGKCICLTAWTGYACDRKCSCANGYCDNSGNCICNPGWQGRTCGEPCDDGYYGDDCSDFCGLHLEKDNLICDPIDGPECAPGFIGEDCQEPCPDGYFGRECKQKCLCDAAAKCNKVTGKCECEPGWQGPKCDKPCPTGLYGMGCENECVCFNCRPTDGFCCQPLSDGISCEIYCSPDDFDFSENFCRRKSRSSSSSTLSISRLIVIMTFALNIFSRLQIG